MPHEALTTDQHRILALLAEGKSIHASALEVGIHRNTIRNWRRSLPAFAHQFNYAIEEQAAVWQEQSVHLAPRATTVLYDLLNNPETSDSIRLRAALAVLKMASDPKGRTLPANLTTDEPAQTASAPAAAAVHNEIPKTRTITHNAPGRNAACSCGSGQKYKRCCDPNAPPKAQIAQAAA